MSRRTSFRETTMRSTSSLVLALALSLAAWGQSASIAAQQAQQTANALTGDAAGRAADNPQCRIFTPEEIATYLGAPAKVGTNAAMSAGCQ